MDRIEKVDKIINEIARLLPDVEERNGDEFCSDRDCTEILSTNESEIEVLANLFDQLYGEGTVNTGYYDPEDDERNNEVDIYTGLYYVSVA